MVGNWTEQLFLFRIFDDDSYAIIENSLFPFEYVGVSLVPFFTLYISFQFRP